MLRERASRAIALLHHAVDTSDSFHSDPILLSDPVELDRMRSLLISSGLLDDQGRLLRPLSSISLYEILAIVDEGIYPFSHDDNFNELPRQTAMPVCKQGMYRTMIRELLCHMKVSEL